MHQNDRKDKNNNQSKKKTTKAGRSNFFHCGGEDHWERDCPKNTEEQRAQLMMNLEEGEEEDSEDGIGMWSTGRETIHPHRAL